MLTQKSSRGKGHALATYTFGTHTLRTLIDENGDPHFIANDVCAVLDLANPRDALNRLDDDEKGVATTDTPGGRQQVTTINESGLYSLILSSRKAEAKAFKKWVTSQVLPAIHKTGSYTQKLSPVQALFQAVKQLVDHEQRLDSIEARLNAADQWTNQFSIIGYCNLRGLHTPTAAEAMSMGRKATKASLERGYQVGKISDTRFGTVNTYRTDVLDSLFGRVR